MLLGTSRKPLQGTHHLYHCTGVAKDGTALEPGVRNTCGHLTCGLTDSTEDKFLEVLCKFSELPGVHIDKKKKAHLLRSHTQTHTKCHLQRARQLMMIFIVIHVLIYSLMADVRQGCNMQMLVCFSMGIFRSAASSCH